MRHCLLSPIALLALGCATKSPSETGAVVAIPENASTSESSSTAPTVQTPPSASAPVEDEGPAREVMLTQDTPVPIAAGVTLTLLNGIEARVTDKNNEHRSDFIGTVRAIRGSDTRDITLHRLTPEPGEYSDVFGLQVALIMVDGYHSPTTAQVSVRRGKP